MVRTANSARSCRVAGFGIVLCLFTPPSQDAGQASSPKQSLSVKQIWNLNATYNDQSHGLTFRYPSSWRPAIQFGYHPPALSSNLVPTAGFGYENQMRPGRISNPYSLTNLEGFGVVYAAVAAGSASECETRATAIADVSENTIVSINGHRYTVRKTASAGMSQSNDGLLYSTYVAPTCYLLETDLARSQFGPEEGVQPLTPAQLSLIQSNLLKIMKSVRIASRH